MANNQSANLTSLISPIVLPLIRKVMSQTIAASLVSVQPMTGPTALIFSLRASHSHIHRILMNKAKYKVFLRLNDRKKSQSLEDLNKTTYPKISIKQGIAIIGDQYIDWCNKQYGEDSFIFYRTPYIIDIWFENTNDAMLFKLRWS